ncbi:DUF512 domain-containing protein [bacterium]|nr:DUF512 domain-containing protein [bacterium]
MKIKALDINSPLYGDIIPGDDLISIDDNLITDILDYYFAQAGEVLDIEFERDGKKLELQIEKEYDQSLGLNFKPLAPRTCNNNCIFCFVDQAPPGLRDSLKVKDEDYRLSFLYGNFLTLSNLKKSDLNRIKRMRLSPLYISVHAWDSKIRNNILGRKKDDGFHEKFFTLLKYGIELHCQIVVIPGINDKEILKQTILELGNHYPGVASIAVIPVGLTEHRDNLPELSSFSKEDALEAVSITEELRSHFNRKLGDPLIYCADEIFLKAELDFPEDEYYGDYPQIENGVGMARRFLGDLEYETADLPETLISPIKTALITGASMAPLLRQYLIPILSKISGLEAEVVEVSNHFFGESVTVSGLLAGGDISEACEKMNYDYLILPPNCLNYDDLFIDDMTVEDLQKTVRIPILQYKGSFSNLIVNLTAPAARHQA